MAHVFYLCSRNSVKGTVQTIEEILRKAIDPYGLQTLCLQSTNLLGLVLGLGNITQSPIWDTDIGFGGNGSTTQDTLLATRGECHISGPFAGL